LLVLAVALFVGLGVAIFVKNIGLLFPQPAAAVPPPPPEVRVVAAAKTLFKGDVVLPGDVGTRVASAAEVAAMKEKPGLFLPATPDAVNFRFLAQNVEANTPITREMLDAPRKPDALNTRLPAGTKAVSVAVAKERSAGGLIQLGDWVDVYITTVVGRSDSKSQTPRTALIAKNANVIVKRNTLFPVYAPLPNDVPVDFTIAVNPYRAALIEHASSFGQISLIPANEVEKKRLDGIREQIGADPDKAVLLTSADVESSEYRDELRRVRDYTSGKLSIGTEQMLTVLGLKPLNPPARPLPPIAVEVLNGGKSKTAFFARSGDDGGEVPTPEYIFTNPQATTGKSSKPAGGSQQTPPPQQRRMPSTMPAPAPTQPRPSSPPLPPPQLRSPASAPNQGGGGL
jgi:Flp pilus assembly protein CpaB